MLIAEDITSRFLNALSLFAGSIPLIAIQLNALRVGGSVVLDLVKVIDQRLLRADDETETPAIETDRAYWERKRGAEPLQLMDQLLDLLNEGATRPFAFNYNKSYVALKDGTRARTFVSFRPRQHHVRVSIRLAEADHWADQCQEAGVAAGTGKGGRLRLNIGKDAIAERRDVIQRVLQRARDEYFG